MAVFYVSTTGSDTTGNGSLSNPYATIAKALSVSSNGDTIQVAAGTYNNTSTIVVNKELSIIGDGYNTIISFNTTPIIGMQILSNNVTIKNCFVKIGPRNSAQCITIGGSANGNTLSNITLENVKVSAENSSTGSYSVYLQSSPNVTSGPANKLSNIIIKNCEIIKAVNGLKVSDNTQIDGFQILATKIYDNSDYGMHVTTPGSFASTSDFNPEVKNVLIENCEMYNNGPTPASGNGDYTSGAIYIEKMKDSTIKNCKFTAKTIYTGKKHHLVQFNMKRGDGNGDNLTVKDCQYIGGNIVDATGNVIVNNTTTTNQSGGLNIKGRSDGTSYSKDPATVKNLICINNNFTGFGIGLRFEDNIVNSNNLPDTVFLENSIFNNNLVDISNWNPNITFRINATNSKFSSISSVYIISDTTNITDEQRASLIQKVTDPRTILRANYIYVNSLMSVVNSLGPIQQGITYSFNNEIIYVGAGTYTENILINKSIAIVSDNKATTILQPPGSTTTATVQITDGATGTSIKNLTVKGKYVSQTTTGSGDSNNNNSAILVLNTDTTNNPQINNLLLENLVLRQASNGISFNNKSSSNITIKNCVIENNEGTGIRIATNTEKMITLLMDGCTIQNNNLNAINSNSSGSYRPNCTNYQINNCIIKNNNKLTVNNQHDVSMFGFNGDISITDTSIESDHYQSKQVNGSAATLGGWGLIIYGAGVSSFQPSGNITMTNVTMTGNVIKSVLGFDRYAALGNIVMNNVDIKDCQANKAGQTWSQLSIGHTDASKSFELGTTKLKTMNTANTGNVNATQSSFYDNTSGILLDPNNSLDLQQINYQIYDKTDNPALGEVVVIEGAVFVNPTITDSIGNSLNDPEPGTTTVYLPSGTYTQTSGLVNGSTDPINLIALQPILIVLV